MGNAWAGFGSSFGPLILLSLLWKRTTAIAGLLGMIVGGGTVLAWVYLPHDYKEVYEMIPGFILSFITIVVVSLLSKAPDLRIEAEFDAMKRVIK